MEDFIYDGSADSTRHVMERYPNGDLRVLCPQCQEELIVVLDEEAMRRSHRHAGVYCPNGHVEILFELRSVREHMDALFERLRGTKPDQANAAIVETESDSDGWVTCPGCRTRFALKDARFSTAPGLWQHGCGQRLRAKISGCI